jgi:hypothetical protein
MRIESIHSAAIPAPRSWRTAFTRGEGWSIGSPGERALRRGREIDGCPSRVQSSHEVGTGFIAKVNYRQRRVI